MNINVKRIKRTKGDFLLLKKKIKHLGATFCSKLIIKLTEKIFIPDLYLQILKYEYNNRTNDDIAKTLPRFQTLEFLNEYIKYKEDKNNDNSSKIILELARVSFYQYKKKLTFVKKANEDINNFYLILNGTLSQLTLTFKKEKISIEEYLIYMIKMKLLQEKQILNKCNKLNCAFVNLDINNFRTFFIINKDYNFKELKHRAKKELIEAGFIFLPNNKIIIPSLENYIKLSFFQTVERNDTQTRFHLFIGNYVKINTLSKGDYIGDLSPNENNEGCTYLCNKNCDICYVNKLESVKSKLYNYMLEKYIRIFKKIKHKFYIFKDTDDDICLINFVPLMALKKYKKGEKIIIQNSQYEGIYFIIDGDVKISISQTFNELSNTLISLQYSIFNFKDYVSKIIKTIDIIKEFNLKYMLKNKDKNMINIKDSKINNDILSSNEYLSYFNGIKSIDFYNLSEGDIVGLNELFDYKTELYNFNAECVSDEVNVFFLSKKNFSNIMEKENNIMNNVIQLIDLKAKSLIGKINNFRYDYRNVVINTLSNKKSKNRFLKDSIFTIFNEIKSDKKEVSKELNNKKTKPNDSINNSKIRDIIMGNNKNKKNKSIIKSVKLFKNNELLNYLKNRELVRSNSITDSLTLNNVNKELLSHRYIYISNYNNIFGSNSAFHNPKKKIIIKNNYLYPQFNPGVSRNNSDDNKTNLTKGNEKNNSTSIINMHLKNNNSSKIIFKNAITPIGNGESLLFDIINNQKKFDVFQKDNFYSDKLPSIKKNNKKNEDILFKKMGKTFSFKNVKNKKFKISVKY